MLCTRCKKRQAIVFVQRMEGSETTNCTSTTEKHSEAILRIMWRMRKEKSHGTDSKKGGRSSERSRSSRSKSM